MRVLDLDMDFFLTGVCELAPRGARPSLREARPWAEADVRAFLEENCGLSRQNPIPGRVFETHDGALFLWKEWLEAGRLSAPFHVTHVDAHSDLGIGRPGPAYVLETVLALPLDGSQPPTAIRLSSTLARLLPQYDFLEPVIPYKSYDDFRAFRAAAPYDLASLAISPRYAPQEADFIADVFREYITEV